MQKLVETDMESKKIFPTKMLSAGFVGMIDKFNGAWKQAIWDTGFGGFLELQGTELSGDLCKWLMDNFDPY